MSAELVPPMVHEYRRKLQHLEGLEFTAVSTYLSKYPEYSKVSVHFNVRMRDGKASVFWVKVTVFRDVMACSLVEWCHTTSQKGVMFIFTTKNFRTHIVSV
jgi:hypothetical protein